MGAARELFEETGMDLRSSLDRLEPAALRAKNKVKSGSSGDEVLTNEYKHRLFYFLSVKDDDFPKGGGVSPMGTEGKHLRVRM